MNGRMLHLLLMAGLVMLIFGCSNKNSNEACIHQVTMDLDSGRYDAVIASSCADPMQKGAAYFARAGFTTTAVINQLISANTETTQSDLTLYMTKLVPATVTSATLADLDNARTEYNLIPSTADTYKDALFYVSLVEAVKSLSLIKIVTPNIVNADGTLIKTCDANANGVPDDADATACELLAASGQACTGAAYAPLTPLPITLVSSVTGTVSGTYSGLTITMTGSGDTTGCTPPNSTTYTRLLYNDTATGKWFAATTTSDPCQGSDGNQWPCPVIGQNLDLAATIDASINNSIISLNSAVTGTTNSDVQQSINDIQSQACKTPCSTVVCPGASCPQSCASGATMYCSSQDIANYIETNLK